MTPAEAPPRTARRQRRLRAWHWLAVVTVGGALTALLFLPFWFPLALGQVLGRYGVEAAVVRRQGYTMLWLGEVRYRSAPVEIRARSVTLPQPTAWLWRRWVGGTDPSASAVVIEDWAVAVSPTATNRPAAAVPAPVSVAALLNQATNQLARWMEWLPAVELRAGRLDLAGEEVRIPEVRWRAGELSAGVDSDRFEGTARVVIRAQAPDRFALEVTADRWLIGLKAEVFARDGGWMIGGEGVWRGNPVTVQARYGRATEGWWPDQLEVKAPYFQLPADVLNLPGYSMVTGRAELTGRGDQWSLQAAAGAEPASTNLPPVRVELGANLNLEVIEIERLECRSPVLNLTLSNPFTWRIASRQVDRPCRLTVAVVLDAQSWVDAHGRATGEVTVQPGRDFTPEVDLSLAGQGIEVWGVTVDRFSLTAHALGTQVNRFEFEAGWTNGSLARLHARDVDLVRRTLAAGEVAVSMKPGVVPPGWLPFEFASVDGTGSFSGAVTNLEHRGTLAAAGVRVNGLREFAVAGEWRGTGLAEIEPGLRLRTDRGEIELAGRVQGLAEVRLTRFSVRRADDPPLELQGQATIRFGREATLPAPGGLTVEAQGLVLTNRGCHLAIEGQVRWPRSARLAVGATNLEARLLEAFLDRELPAVKLETLSAGVEAGIGPARWTLATTASLDASGDGSTASRPTAGERLIRTARVEATLEGDATGTRILELRLFDDGVDTLQVAGRVPLLCGFLGDGRFWELKRTQPLDLRLRLTPTERLQRWLDDRAGIRATGIVVTGALTGTLAAPEGGVSLRAQSIRAPVGSPIESWWPRIEEVEVVLRVGTNRLTLDPVELQIEGAPLQATVELPLTGAFWEGLAEGRFELDWATLSGGIRLPHLAVPEGVAGRVPWLRAEGQVSADVRLRPGWNWEGDIQVTGVGTRPIPVVGPVRQIQGRIDLRDRRAIISRIEAEVGGAVLRLGGWIDLPADRRGLSTIPHFDLGLTGREVPLARQAGLIIRGDLDLHLRHGATNPPTVEGSVVFGRSLVLSDLGDLLERRVRTAGGLGAPVRVSQEPLAGWRLAVELRGDEFLQLKSPFYNGVHSVNLKLRGTLGEPLLLGDAQVVRGLVVFPYASLRVQRGIVTFSEEAPWRPRVEALASARVFGYDVRVEVGGNADVPVVQFSSSPPLSSEAILMMMTAGELPRHQLNYSTTERMTRLATILGRDVMNKLGGQDASEDRLSVRSGEAISTGGRVTQSVEYRLSERFSLVGEYDEYDALNAGVKWRVLRR